MLPLVIFLLVGQTAGFLDDLTYLLGIDTSCAEEGDECELNAKAGRTCCGAMSCRMLNDGWRSEVRVCKHTGDHVEDRPVLVKTGVECNSGDTKRGESMTLEECAQSVFRAGGHYFVFGTGRNSGYCYTEHTSSEYCPEGWEVDNYDFYKLGPRNVEVELAATSFSDESSASGDEIFEAVPQADETSVVVYGFAAVGLGFLLLQGGRYLYGKTSRTNVEYQEV